MATLRTQNPGDSTVTVIGSSVQVKGNLSGDEDLHVLGRVDGRIELERTLIVAESGIVKAEVQVKNAIVSGVVVGNIHASESVEITREGRMVGDIYAPRVIIVDGASFRGSVDMGDIENMPIRKPTADRPRPAPVARPAPSPAARPSTPAAKPVAAPAPSRPAVVAKDDRSEAKTEKVAVVPASPSSASALSEPPAAKGLPQKSQKTRVIVKRK
jgi:cytoskeletal protein CcmA (bactofilin family)